MNQLTTVEPREIAQAEQNNSAGMLAMIAEAARDQTVDAQKMVTLADLAMKLQDRELQAQFNRDKVSAIQQMPSIGKRGEIIIPAKDGKTQRTQGRYAKWEDLHKIISPILAAHNLVLTFNIGHREQMVTVQPILSHTNGIVEKGEFMVLPLDTSGSKNNTQGAGSSSSYGKRYAAGAMLNLVYHDDIDDDGAGGSATPADHLSDEQHSLVDAGRSAAMNGTAAYTEWFGKLPAAQKGWLAFEPYHAQNKQAAEAIAA